MYCGVGPTLCSSVGSGHQLKYATQPRLPLWVIFDTHSFDPLAAAVATTLGQPNTAGTTAALETFTGIAKVAKG